MAAGAATVRNRKSADELPRMSFAGNRRPKRKRRRSPRRARNAAIVLAMLAFLVASAYELVRFAGAVAQLPPGAWRKPWGGIERYEPAPDYRAARARFPYSVVPGGVLSDTEVNASIAKDAVVARHYRDILAARLQLARLNAAVEVYASYRSANSVYWTTHKIRVPRGELILSDGTHMIRARCGNRLAFTLPLPDWSEPVTPDRPIPPKRERPPIEPPELVFESGTPPIFNPPIMPPPLQSEEAPPTVVTHYWPPAVPPTSWCCGSGGIPGGWHPARPGRPGRPEPRTPEIPEPAAVLLLGTAVIVTVIWRAR